MKKLFVKEDKSSRPASLRRARFVEFPNLKPTSEAISLRLPSSVLSRLRIQAHARGVPYQSHIKALLAAAVEK